MVAYSRYTLESEQTWQLDGVKGTLAVANGSSAVIMVVLDKLSGASETVTLARLGDALTANTEPYRKVTISASGYPSPILLVISPAHDLVVTSISDGVAGGVIAAGGSSGMLTLAETRVSVGMAAVEIAPLAGQRGLIVRADAANASVIYLGDDNGVDATGWPLAAGESLPIDAATSIWVIAGAADQLLHVLRGA